MTPDGWRIGVDIGGTFTDVALTPPAAAREYGAHDAEALGCPWCRAGDRAPSRERA